MEKYKKGRYKDEGKMEMGSSLLVVLAVGIIISIQALAVSTDMQNNINRWIGWRSERRAICIHVAGF